MRESNGVPSWMIKLIAGTLITLSMGAGAAWIGKVNAVANANSIEIVKIKSDKEHTEATLSRIESKVDGIDLYLRDHNTRYVYSKPRVIYRSAPKDGTVTYGDDDVLEGTPSKPRENL